MTVETIYACASGPGPSAIAVYRVSGPESDAVLGALTSAAAPEPRRAALRRLRHPETGDVVDEALILRFAPGAGYTGERSLEIHIHGGLAVRSALEDALEAAGARLARPGEFSRRAFLAGRLDLAQAEAVATLIEAETQAERRQALEVLDGVVGRQAALWRRELTDLAALIETGIDFVEEGIEETIASETLRRAEDLAARFSAETSAARDAQTASSKPLVALIGAPNAGKSSLLNAILEQDAAIVSPRAGTTRDAVAGELVIDGAGIRVVDTAGIRFAEDEIERIGVDRARAVAERADLRILVASRDTGAPSERLTALLKPEDAIFWTKADLARPTEGDLAGLPELQLFIVSALDSTAAKAFDEAIAGRRIGRRAAGSTIAGSKRRARLVDGALARLRTAIAAIRSDRPELAAEECRGAAIEIERLVGAIDNEDVLDALFGRFCIGK